MNADLSPMHRALACAKRAVLVDEVPIGAAIVRQGQIISVAHNLTRTRQDPTAHAEIVAIRAACRQLAVSRLDDCDIYVTLEPCAMCAQAIAYAHLRRLYFGAADPKGGGVDHGACVFDKVTCHHRPEVYSGIGERAASTLLQDFFRERRRHDH